jgi:CHAT domain-containing protein
VLEAHEIVHLQLSAELVVCSACQTALGSFWEGEGVVGLTGAFFTAGCEAAIVSLWSVSDRPTADLMVELYRGLAAGMPAAAALRRAKRIIRVRRPHPRYWAAFELVGVDWRGRESAGVAGSAT